MDLQWRQSVCTLSSSSPPSRPAGPEPGKHHNAYIHTLAMPIIDYTIRLHKPSEERQYYIQGTQLYAVYALILNSTPSAIVTHCKQTILYVKVGATDTPPQYDWVWLVDIPQPVSSPPPGGQRRHPRWVLPVCAGSAGPCCSAPLSFLPPPHDHYQWMIEAEEKK